jgi:hypothetical protein
MPSFPTGAARKGGRVAAERHRRKAAEFYAPIVPVVVFLRGVGMSLRAIGLELTRKKIKTRYQCSGRWSVQQVKRVLARARDETPAADQPLKENQNG